MKISKELVGEVFKLNICEAYIENNKLYFDMGLPLIQSINIYEFAFKNLKQWAKLKNVFDKIDWSEEPEQIFKKAEKLKNEIN